MSNDTPFLCDACGAEIEGGEVYTGNANTEYEGCTLCPECAEVNDGTAREKE